MNDDRKLSQEEIEDIADQLWSEGFRRSEAFPIEGWRKRGWPESRQLFKVIDAKLKYMTILEDYGKNESRQKVHRSLLEKQS